jgi:hypothetical protein
MRASGRSVKHMFVEQATGSHTPPAWSIGKRKGGQLTSCRKSARTWVMMARDCSPKTAAA